MRALGLDGTTARTDERVAQGHTASEAVLMSKVTTDVGKPLCMVVSLLGRLAHANVASIKRP
jgi:hypothetical protein